MTAGRNLITATTALALAAATFAVGIAVPATATTGDVQNGRIAFTSNRTGTNEIWVMESDGSNQTQLTSGGPGRDEAAWSPDGSRIAFIGASTTGHPEVFVMNADGSAQTQLTTSTNFGGVHAPTWSPDGTQIAFVRATSMYVINADGTNDHRVNVTWFGGQENPAWSTDGTRLYFTGLPPAPDNIDYGMFWLSADGTGTATRVTTGRDSNAIMSPDGSKLAYNRAPAGLAQDIYTVNTDGTGSTNLTSTSVGENEPSWAPEGNGFAFHGTGGGDNIDIYTVDAAGDNPVRLTTDEGTDVRAAWQPVPVPPDTTPPDVQCGTADGAWHADDVAITCTATDAESGLADPTQSSVQLTTNVPAGTEDATASTGSQQVCDNAGNCADAGPVTGNMVDKGSPTVSLFSPVNQTYLLNQSVTADFSCRDGGSGINTCTGSVGDGTAVDTATVGTKSFSVTAADGVGNPAATQVGYDVGYDVELGYDPALTTRKVLVRLTDANGVNVSAQSIGLQVVSIDGTAVTGTFGFNKRALEYSYAPRPRTLSPGSHVLRFTAGADPTVHEVAFTTR